MTSSVSGHPGPALWWENGVINGAIISPLKMINVDVEVMKAVTDPIDHLSYL